MTLSQRNLTPYFLVIPFLSHWLLPASIESKIYVNIFGIPVYLFDICYILYILNHSSIDTEITRKVSSKCKSLIFVIFPLILWVIFNMIISSVDHPFALLLCNTSILGYSFLLLLFPIDKSAFSKTKPLLIASLVILCAEVILFSTGLLSYSTDNGDIAGQEYEGIFRISTTVGASTGTGVAIVFLAILVLSYCKLKVKLRVCIMLLVSLSLLFLLSRGPLLVWILYLLLNLYYNIIRHHSNSKALKTILIAGFFALLFVYLGFLDPLLSRVESLGSDFSTGRDEARELAINANTAVGGLGVGFGRIYPDKSIGALAGSNIIYGLSPHNLYVVFLSELGWPGLFLVVLLFVCFLARISYKNETGLTIVLLMLITCNTECVVLYNEFMIAFLLIIYLSISEKFESALHLLS